MPRSSRVILANTLAALGLSVFLGAGACHGCDSDASDTPTVRDAGIRDLGVPDLGRDLGPPDSGAEDPRIIRGLRGGGSFFERPDGTIRERLATLPLVNIERGYGGRSVAFKIELSDGTVGYYKPNQTFSAAHWWSEVAAYHLDRELHLGRVPPVVSRRLPWADLRRVAPNDEHFPEVVVDEDGTMCGSFSHWIPDRLSPVRLPSGWERWLRITGHFGTTTPFQRAREYTAALHGTTAEAGDAGLTPTTPTTPAGTTTPAATPTNPAAAAALAVAAPSAQPVASPTETTADRPVARAGVEPDREDRDAELSDLVVFDFLTQNTDRWGGGNANVLTRGGGPIVFLDNAAGFPRRAPTRLGLMDARFRVVQRFRGRTIAALRAFDIHAFARRMQAEPCAPILDQTQLNQLEERRRHVLQRANEIQAEFGDAAIPW